MNEFIAYANVFFPVEDNDLDPKKIEDDFDLAWFNHIRNNPHHPEYWTYVDDAVAKIHNMPNVYIIEMLYDWMAMSNYYNSTTLDYWNSDSARKLPMTINTISKVDEFIKWLQKYNVHTLF